ncbi:MAG TPA: rRNA maturation RNase YbeY [Candidatus Bathyarchaeia archaeon]|nr:rRNA maturation RNase YbeY [Candidatus Bathyarchaeia archaeon]
MKTSIEIANLTKKRIDPKYIRKIVRKTAKLAEVNLSSLGISVVFVCEAEIRKLNREYRKKNKSTDVLSFNLVSGYNKVGKVLEGELVLCPVAIAKNARENKVHFSRELSFVLAHGMLHVLGWRHGKKMYALQDKVSSEL